MSDRLPWTEVYREFLDWYTDVIYEQGYRAALCDIAARTVELDETWRSVGRREYADAVAARLRLMERHAARLAEEMGRPGYTYQGGPVDWDTGQPCRKDAA